MILFVKSKRKFSFKQRIRYSCNLLPKKTYGLPLDHSTPIFWSERLSLRITLNTQIFLCFLSHSRKYINLWSAKKNTEVVVQKKFIAKGSINLIGTNPVGIGFPPAAACHRKGVSGAIRRRGWRCRLVQAISSVVDKPRWGVHYSHEWTYERGNEPDTHASDLVQMTHKTSYGHTCARMHVYNALIFVFVCSESGLAMHIFSIFNLYHRITNAFRKNESVCSRTFPEPNDMFQSFQYSINTEIWFLPYLQFSPNPDSSVISYRTKKKFNCPPTLPIFIIENL